MIKNERLEEHPFASVTVTLKLPAAKLIALPVNETEGFQLYWYGDVPPFAVNDAEPFDKPKHETFCEFIFERDRIVG